MNFSCQQEGKVPVKIILDNVIIYLAAHFRTQLMTFLFCYDVFRDFNPRSENLPKL